MARHKPPATHVDAFIDRFSDGGSTPPTSTILFTANRPPGSRLEMIEALEGGFGLRGRIPLIGCDKIRRGEETMCGRFSLGGSAATLAGHFNVQESVAWHERWNIAPSQEVLTIIQPAGEPRTVRRMRWGLIPSWAKDPAIGNQLINARAETVATKPAFRAALKDRRCLIATDGFYEWEAQGRRKQPWCIRMRDGRPFAFAGLWERWTDPAGRAIETCTIITTTPNALIQRFHHRMPVIVAPREYDLWLDVQMRDVDRLQALLVPYPPEEMVAYPVSALVNNPANDSPDCQTPEK